MPWFVVLFAVCECAVVAQVLNDNPPVVAQLQRAASSSIPAVGGPQNEGRPIPRKQLSAQLDRNQCGERWGAQSVEKELRTVDVRLTDPLGIGIDKERRVTTVVPDGQGDRLSITVGDELIGVDGTSMVGESDAAVLAALSVAMADPKRETCTIDLDRRGAEARPEP